ncbi:ABC transporter permease [Terrisporobacter vanillatitrophus]|uniref:ABC transporter permease n=1 Tax=Terrisporobacter vanillatitrophus TaxID=3058402 RepID=UPI003365DD0B
MQVYKAFFKVIHKNLSQISIYIVVFVVFAIALGSTKQSPNDINFEDTKVNIAFINQDEDTKIVEGLKKYLSTNTNIVSIGTTKEELQDALYFREVEYIVTIPKGFTGEILSNNTKVNIEKTTIPNSVSEVYIDNLVNRYLNTAKKYNLALGNISQSDLVKYINKGLDYSTKVEVSTYESGYVSNIGCKNYYNYFAYSIFAILILGVTAVMLTFENKDLKMRNLSSALTMRSLNFQLVLGNISYAVVTWIIMILASFVMYKGYMLSMNGLLFLVNSFIFTLAALSIGLLISTFVKSRSAMSAAANVVSLGFCFISGVFVPQMYLGETVISIAKFNPTYWYIKANEEISVLVNFNMDNLIPIINSMLIVLGFAIAILSVTLVIMKQKKISN